jgi:hypothetical protein
MERFESNANQSGVRIDSPRHDLTPAQLLLGAFVDALPFLDRSSLSYQDDIDPRDDGGWPPPPASSPSPARPAEGEHAMALGTLKMATPARTSSLRGVPRAPVEPDSRRDPA